MDVARNLFCMGGFFIGRNRYLHEHRAFIQFQVLVEGRHFYEAKPVFKKFLLVHTRATPFLEAEVPNLEKLSGAKVHSNKSYNCLSKAEGQNMPNQHII